MLGEALLRRGMPEITTISTGMQKIQRRSLLYSGMSIFGIVFFALVLLWIFKPVPMSPYKNAEQGIRINYPKGWQVVESPGPGAIVAFLAPKQEKYINFLPNVNVTCVPQPRKKLTEEQLTQVTYQQLMTLFQGKMKLVEDAPIFLAGRTGHKFQFTGLDTANSLQYLCAWVWANDCVYVITYAAPAVYFGEFSRAVDNMLRSFAVE